MKRTPGPAGLDLARVSAWLHKAGVDIEPPVTARLIAGGRSNLTFDLRDDLGRRLVLRRPPLGNVLESAHDVAREHRIIAALAPSAVPVADALALCEDTSVIGAPFYVMRFIEGLIVRDEAEAERLLPSTLRAKVSDAVIDALVDLHAVAPDEVGLGSLGRHDGYLERQLRRWQRQWEGAKTREVPAVDAVGRLLHVRRPPQQRTSIVHGDYRIDNIVLTPAGGVAAVLDWELCTLGDPLADLGMLLLYWRQPGDSVDYLLSSAPTVAGGFRPRAEVAERYAARSGLDVSAVGYYVAFSLWKLACIGEGILVRYRSGSMGDRHGVDVGGLDRTVWLLAEQALEVLEELP